MTQVEKDENCASKKPWGEILSGSLKKIIWKSADGLGEEGGRSLGKILFYVFLGLLILLVGSYILGTVTGFFDGWFSWEFDLWPFGNEEAGTWFGDGAETPVETPEVATPDEIDSEPGFWSRTADKITFWN